MHDALNAQGVYEIVCRDPNGRVKWQTESPNLVALQGADLMLDCAFSNSLGGSSFAGLISSSGYLGINLTDTLTSKRWQESTCYSTRPSINWGRASNARKVSTSLQFVATESDFIVGAFIVYGSGATASPFNTGGFLWSASQFQNGTQSVINGDTITVQYVTSLIRIAPVTSFVVVQVESGHADADSTVFAPTFLTAEFANSTIELDPVFHYTPHQAEIGDGFELAIADFIRGSPVQIERVNAVEVERSRVDYIVSQTETGSANDIVKSFGTDPTSVLEFSTVGNTTQTLTVNTNSLTSRTETTTAASTQGARMAYLVSDTETATNVNAVQTSTDTAHPGRLESGTGASTQGATLNYRPIVPETGTAASTQAPHITRHPADAENTNAVGVQSAAFILRPSVQNITVAFDQQSATVTSSAANVNEFDLFAAATQDSKLAYKVTTAEGSATATDTEVISITTVDESTTASSTQIVHVTRNASIAETTTASDSEFTNAVFVVDALGNFLVDASGNRVIVAGTGP